MLVTQGLGYPSAGLVSFGMGTYTLWVRAAEVALVSRLSRVEVGNLSFVLVATNDSGLEVTQPESLVSIEVPVPLLVHVAEPGIALPPETGVQVGASGTGAVQVGEPTVVLVMGEAGTVRVEEPGGVDVR